MKYRTLGKTGIEVSQIGIGAWQLGGPLTLDGVDDGHPDPGRENVIKMIRDLGDSGVNFIDTAEQYSQGESERRVGEAIKGNRDKWVISTKFGHKVGEGNTRRIDTSPDSIMPALEGSLERLGIDTIDVYHFHTDPEVEFLDQSAKVLAKAKDQGMIRAIGISTNDLHMCKELHNRGMLDVVQYISSILEPNEEMQNFILDNKLGAIVRGVMAGGCLTGKYFHKDLKVEAGDRRKWSQENYARYKVFEDLVPNDMNMAQMATRFVLDSDATHTIIAGAKNFKDYQSSLTAVHCPALSKELRNMLKQTSQILGFN